MQMEGGFQGRPNKLVDGCYSFWVGALFPLLEAIMTRQQFEKDVKQRNSEVTQYIGTCQILTKILFYHILTVLLSYVTYCSAQSLFDRGIYMKVFIFYFINKELIITDYINRGTPRIYFNCLSKSKGWID